MIVFRYTFFWNSPCLFFWLASLRLVALNLSLSMCVALFFSRSHLLFLFLIFSFFFQFIFKHFVCLSRFVYVTTTLKLLVYVLCSSIPLGHCILRLYTRCANSITYAHFLSCSSWAILLFHVGRLFWVCIRFKWFSFFFVRKHCSLLFFIFLERDAPFLIITQNLMLSIQFMNFIYFVNHLYLLLFCVCQHDRCACAWVCLTIYQSQRIFSVSSIIILILVTVANINLSVFQRKGNNTEKGTKKNTSNIWKMADWNEIEKKKKKKKKIPKWRAHRASLQEKENKHISRVCYGTFCTCATF